jgi:hypothetical protein
MGADGKARSFTLPSQLANVPGAEGWRSTYPYYTRFQPEDDQHFWSYNAMHFPEPMPALMPSAMIPPWKYRWRCAVVRSPWPSTSASATLTPSRICRTNSAHTLPSTMWANFSRFTKATHEYRGAYRY